MPNDRTMIPRSWLNGVEWKEKQEKKHEGLVQITVHFVHLWIIVDRTWSLTFITTNVFHALCWIMSRFHRFPFCTVCMTSSPWRSLKSQIPSFLSPDRGDCSAPLLFSFVTLLMLFTEDNVKRRLSGSCCDTSASCCTVTYSTYELLSEAKLSMANVSSVVFLGFMLVLIFAKVLIV